MGTRADFYVRAEKSEPKMKWIGSKAFDGYPDGIDEKVLKSTTEEDFIKNTEDFLKDNDDATLPEQGWPWPWKDSRTTDYSYIFETGKVMASCFGYPLFDPLEMNEEERDEDASKLDGYFPDMKDVQNIQWGKQSGLIVISVK